MNPTSGSDILNYTGNANLGLNTEGLSYAGDTDATLINQAVNTASGLNFQKNQYLYLQKKKEKDETLALIAAGKINIPMVRPEDRPKMLAKAAAVKQILLDSKGDVKSNIETYTKFQGAIQEFDEAKKYATSRLIELDKMQAEIAGTERPDLKRAYQDHYNKEVKKDIYDEVLPFQHTLDHTGADLWFNGMYTPQQTTGVASAQYDRQGNIDVTEDNGAMARLPAANASKTGGGITGVPPAASQFYDVATGKPNANFERTSTGVLNYEKMLDYTNANYMKNDGTGSFYKVNDAINDTFKGSNSRVLEQRANAAIDDLNKVRITKGLPPIEHLLIQRDQNGNVLTDQAGNIISGSTPVELKAKLNLIGLKPIVSSSAVDKDAADVGKTKAEIDKLRADAQSNRIKANGYADAQHKLGKKYAMQTKRLEQDAMPKEFFDEVQNKAYITTSANGNDLIRVRWGDLQTGAQQALGIQPLTAGNDKFVNGTLNAYNANGPVSDDVVLRRYRQAVKEQDFKGNVFDYLKKFNVNYEFEVIGRQEEGNATKISRSGRLSSFRNQNSKVKKNDLFLEDGDFPQETNNE